jgi:peptide/nickel transport system substrate-binding protein
MSGVLIRGRVFGLLLAGAALSALLGGCGRAPKYHGTFRIGVSDLPTNLMPYNSAAESATMIAGLLYDTLLAVEILPLGAEDPRFRFPDGSSFSPVDSSENPYRFTDGLLKVSGVLPGKPGSPTGREDDYTPTLSQRGALLERKGFLNVSDREKERAVPSDNWITYKFEIAEGHRWNDGVPFSAHDVKFSFDYIISNAGAFRAQAAFLGMYSHSEVSGDGRYISIYLGTHKPGDIKSIVNSILILPKHIWEPVEKPRNEKNTLNPVGTGPYKLAENGYAEGSSVTLELRDDYFFAGKTISKKAPRYISVVQYGTVDIMLNELNGGKIDTIYGNLEIAKAQQIKNNPRLYGNIKLMPVPDEFVTTLLFNQQAGRYGDDAFDGRGRAFRRAVSLAIDQEALIETVLFGYGTPVGGGLVQENQPHALRDEKGNYERHRPDIAEANRLLDQNGFAAGPEGWRHSPRGNPLTVKILAHQSNERLVQALREQFAAIGLRFEYQAADAQYPEIIKVANGSQFDAIVNRVTFASDKLLMFDARYGFYATANSGPRLYNWAGVDDPDLRALIFEMDSEKDILNQYEKSRTVQRHIAGLYAELPLFAENKISAYSEMNYRGWVPVEWSGAFNGYTLRYLEPVQ